MDSHNTVKHSRANIPPQKSIYAETHMENPPTKEWALLVYIAADVSAPGMHWAAERNMLQMVDTGSNDQVYVAVQIDLPQQPTRRYIIPQKPVDRERWTVLPDTSMQNVNSADPQTILDFFAWGIAKCPAKNTMLVLWGHGFGLDDYLPTGVSPVSYPAPGASSTTFKFAPVQDQVVEIPAANFVKPPMFHANRAIVDEQSHTVLNNNQIGDVVRACRKMVSAGTGDLAILGLDCCEMAMAEVWCEMTGGAQVGIGSQASLPYKSWPYDLFLAQLLAKPQSASNEVAQMLVNSFVEFYSTQAKDSYVTLSACNLELCDDLESAVKPLAEALTAASGNVQSRAGIFSARNSCPSYDPDGFIDLDCFCGFLETDVPDDKVRVACSAARRALAKFVIDSGYSPQDPDRMIALSKGLSVWFPAWIQDPTIVLDQKERSEAYLQNGYGQTKFGDSTGWNAFLMSMLRYSP